MKDHAYQVLVLQQCLLIFNYYCNKSLRPPVDISPQDTVDTLSGGSCSTPPLDWLRVSGPTTASWTVPPWPLISDLEVYSQVSCPKGPSNKISQDRGIGSQWVVRLGNPKSYSGHSGCPIMGACLVVRSFCPPFPH